MISKKAFNKIAKKGLTIAFAESMTGGAICAEFVKNPGASNYMKGSVIAYSTETKQSLLGISKGVIETYGIVSFEMSDEMAKSIQEKMHSDIAIGITGNAGPTLQQDTLTYSGCLTIRVGDKNYHHQMDLSHETRIQAIKKSTKLTYELLEKLI